MSIHHRTLRQGLVVLAALLAGTWGYRVFSQSNESASKGSEPTKVQIVQDNDVLLGAGDVRFGVTIEPGGGAIVVRWQNHRAYFIDDQGRLRDLGIRLRHQHAGIAIPPQGLVVLEDLQGDYYAIKADGQLAPISGIR